MYEQADDREGMGCIAWTGVCVLALVVAIAMTCCGCEDDGDTTIIYDGDDITAGSNSSVIVVQDNTGTVSVDQTLSDGGDDPSIYIGGNTGKVYVTTRPEPPPAPEPAP